MSDNLIKSSCPIQKGIYTNHILGDGQKRNKRLTEIENERRINKIYLDKENSFEVLYNEFKYKKKDGKWNESKCIKEIYKNIFDKEIKKYNQQKDEKNGCCRKRDHYYGEDGADYFEKKCQERVKGKKAQKIKENGGVPEYVMPNGYYSFNLQLGKEEDFENSKIDKELAEKIIRRSFEVIKNKYGDNIHFVYAVLHNDEENNMPHIQGGFIPIGNNCKEGLKKQVNLTQALKEMGFENDISQGKYGFLGVGMLSEILRNEVQQVAEIDFGIDYVLRAEETRHEQITPAQSHTAIVLQNMEKAKNKAEQELINVKEEAKEIKGRSRRFYQNEIIAFEKLSGKKEKSRRKELRNTEKYPLDKLKEIYENLKNEQIRNNSQQIKQYNKRKDTIDKLDFEIAGKQDTITKIENIENIKYEDVVKVNQETLDEVIKAVGNPLKAKEAKENLLTVKDNEITLSYKMNGLQTKANNAEKYKKQLDEIKGKKQYEENEKFSEQEEYIIENYRLKLELEKYKKEFGELKEETPKISHHKI